MEPRFTYLFLDLITILGPLALSFDKKVAFYKQWKHWAIATAITSITYILWDIWFTLSHIWEFNFNFLFGPKFLQLPLEEYFFFLVVPYACLFVYACLKAYFPQWKIRNYYFWPTLTSLCGLFAIVNYDKLYTMVTFGLLTITFIALQLYRSELFKSFSAHLWWSWVICIIPMSYVNGILTSKPVLIYNNIENCQFRIGSIPFEDFFYNFLYMTWMITIYEILQKRNKAII